MASSDQSHNRIIVDSVHGDIALDDSHWGIVDTPSFQRLRRLKSLGMAHTTYPNATHTRFAHSIGTFHVVKRALSQIRVTGKNRELLLQAALLHDIGHYPYSHVMERVDDVQLTEDLAATSGCKTKRTLRTVSPYPDHERIGELVLTHQEDLASALGGADRAREVAECLTKSGAKAKALIKLISSSLDMDRLDYLLRDSHATGVPYGNVDINYLLRNVTRGKGGALCITEKGIPAADHFLLARFFMHRTVYYHKTIHGMEEACRQLLRRVRDKPDGKYDIPASGQDVENIVTSRHFLSFTDAFVDNIVTIALDDDKDEIIRLLAQCIEGRCPPKLIRSVEVLKKREHSKEQYHRAAAFRSACRDRLAALCKELKLLPGQLLLAHTRPLALEKRAMLLTASEMSRIDSDDEEELIKVCLNPGEEPQSLVEIDHSMISQCSDLFYQAVRLYFVPRTGQDALAEEIRARVAGWHSSD